MGKAIMTQEERVAFRKKAVDDRRETVIKFMLDTNGEVILGKDLGDMFGCGDETIRKDMVNYIIPKNIGIVKYTEGPGYVYIKPAEEKKPEKLDIFKKEPKMEKAPVVEEKQSNPMKNHEGYVDPTAGKAIEAVDGPEEGPAFAMAGDVWECACSDGTSQRFLIFASFEKFSIGVVLNPTRSGGVPKKYQRKITAGLDTRFTDIRRITTKPNKYMTQKVGHLGGEMYDSILKDAVGMFASLDSNAVTDPDMWNALNEREKDLCKREDHLEERAKEIAKQQLEADDIVFKAKQKQIELADLEEKLRLKEEELNQCEADLHTREMSIDSAGSQTSDLELALLKQKVEIYEKLIFGERRITI